jgi:hypothetical protein
MAPVRNMQYIFTNPHWNQLNTHTLREKNFYPNRVWVNKAAREVAIVLRRSDTDGFSIGVPALAHYEQSLEVGRADQVFVILTDKEGNYIKAQTLGNVLRAIRGREPNRSNDPKWPNYYWLDEDFEVSEPGDFKEEVL